MDAEKLTDEDREYCRRWCTARGIRAHRFSETAWNWFALYGSSDDEHFKESRLPLLIIVGCNLHAASFTSEAAALDALALALREVRAAAAIPSQGAPDAP